MGEKMNGGDDGYTVQAWLSNVVFIPYSTAHINPQREAVFICHMCQTTGRPYGEMLTYKLLTNNAVLRRMKKKR